MDAMPGRYMDAYGRLCIPHGRYVGRCVGAMDSTWTLRGRYVDAMGAMDAMDAFTCASLEPNAHTAFDLADTRVL